MLKNRRRKRERFPPRWVPSFFHMMTELGCYGFTISPPEMEHDIFKLLIEDLIKLMYTMKFVIVVEYAGDRAHVHGAFCVKPRKDSINVLEALNAISKEHGAYFDCRKKKDGQFAACNSGWYSYMMKDLDKTVLRLPNPVITNKDYSGWYTPGPE